MRSVYVLIFLFVHVTSKNFDTDNELEPDDEDTVDNIVLCDNCITKCCPNGQHIHGFNKKCVRPKLFKHLNFSEVPLYNDDKTRSGRNLTDILTLVPERILNPKFFKKAFDYSVMHHNYYLTEEGILYQEVPNHFMRWYRHNTSRYCVEYQLPIKAIGMVRPEVRFWTIIDGTASEGSDSYITIGLLISCFFLILVLVVYSILPELRNLSGMVLMAYVSSLFGAFFILALIQVKRHSNPVCSGLTYTTYFMFLASFCWMNIMSCDIWWTFRGYAKARPIHRRGECFKFVMYCIYAWGLPAALTIMLVALNETDMRSKPWFVQPNIGQYGCFFGESEKLLYLYVPMLFLIMCNWIFFLMTAFNIWRLHRATAVLDSAAAGTPAAHRSQKYRFLVYLKLSIIMGINWVLEVVSSFQPDFKGWYLTDIYNTLIGLSIFLIFVCKKKIWRKLIKRLQTLGEYRRPRQYSSSSRRSRTSNTTESDISQDVPVCINPKGPVIQYTDKVTGMPDIVNQSFK
ncbi:G-protein coupled receptor Mth2-like [Pectinophora gossypiella]|uniref:G-protein coupled receptor Mth2-like n=1 Tax=Pectinophora gossypiella TaxID=13191 RepID=UPI00214F41E2|nr:G-protein coupled receptor Mth2-like [Pectinophora gossypiella]